MSRSLRAARVATFAYFAVNGFVMGTWVVHINVIARQAGVGTAMLGYLLLALGGSAFAGMRLCGPLNDRLGPGRVIPVSAALFSAAVVLPALAHNVWSLAGALAALGFSNGGLDVSMNTHAVKVEHRYRRPIMSAFHATWSLGGVVAAIAGARTISWGWPIVPTFAVIAVLAAATSLLAAPALLADEAATTGARRATGAKPRVPRGVWALATVAMMVMLCEGVAYDWSTVHLRTVIPASAATSALAYGAYATAATAGRLIADRLAARIGPVALFRSGATLAGLGMVTIVLSHQATLAIAAWAAVGLGLSGCIPSCSPPRAAPARTPPEPTWPASQALATWACSPDRPSSDRLPPRSAQPRPRAPHGPVLYRGLRGRRPATGPAPRSARSNWFCGCA